MTYTNNLNPKDSEQLKPEPKASNNTLNASATKRSAGTVLSGRGQQLAQRVGRLAGGFERVRAPWGPVT